VIAIDVGATSTLLPLEAEGTVKWTPTAKQSTIGGIGAGLLSRVKWGEAEIEIGGARAKIEVGFTDGLHDEPGLLSLEAATKLGLRLDYERMKVKAKGGKWIPIVMQRKEAEAFAAVARTTTIPAQSAGWVDLRIGAREAKEAYIESSVFDGARIVEGIWPAQKGLVRVAVLNETDEPLTWKEGKRCANWSEVEETEMAFQIKERKGPRFKEEEEEGEERRRKESEAKRRLITDEEVEEHCERNFKHLTKEEVRRIKEEIILPNREVFLRKGELPINPIRFPAVRLVVTSNPKVAAVRPWTHDKYEVAEKENKRLLDAGISVESSSPFRSEPVIVDKKDGTKRMTIDYRSTLNKVLEFDGFPIPRADEQVRKMAGCGIFSTMDAASSFWQLALAKESQRLTAYRAPPGGHYEMTRVPQGVTVGSAKLCRAVQKTVMDELSTGARARVAHYIDEFLAGSEVEGEGVARYDSHFKLMKELLGVFKAAGWRLGWEKFLIFQLSAEWVGMQVSKEGHAASQSLVKAILECAEPENKTELRRFLGKLNYQAHRIRDYKIIAQPLNRLLGEVPYEFGEEERNAWARLKTEATRRPTLGLLKAGKGVKVKVYVDASLEGIGAEIWQDDKVCGYWNRPLTEKERRYSTLDRELMAAAEASSFVRPLVGNAEIEMQGDHKPLTDEGWRGLPLEPAHDRARDRPKWVAALDSNQVKLSYIRGQDNPADALTRAPFVKFAGMAISGHQRTPKEWAELQDEDPELRRWKKYLTEDELPTQAKKARLMIAESGNYDIHEGVLMNRSIPHLHAKKEEERWLIVVPEKEKEAVLKEFHDRAGHPSAEATAHKIRDAGLYFKGYWADSKRHKANCRECKEMLEMKNEDKVGLLEPTMKLDRGLRVIALDFIGPLPMSEEGYEYVLLSITEDDLWVDAKPGKEQNTELVIQHLTERAAGEDAWDIIKNDRGSPFISEAARAYFEDAGMAPHPTTANNPRANGVSEAHVKILKHKVEMLAAEDPKTWPKKIPIALMQMRSDVKSDSQSSAFEMRFSRPMRLLSHLKFGVTRELKTVTAEEQRRVMREAHKREDLEALKQKERYDKGRVEANFKVGEKVYLKDHKAGFLEKKKIGPFVIVRKVSDLNYEIAECGKAELNNRHPIINVRNLESYELQGAEDEEEYEVQVKEVLAHRKGKGKGKKGELEFHIRWADGSETWEPMANLFDIEEGQRIYNRKLNAYAKEKQIRLKRKE
jgi:hypothetical protein